MWATMKYNSSTNLIQVIKNLYKKATSAVLFNSSIGDWFRTTVGVRQGCLPSPILFKRSIGDWFQTVGVRQGCLLSPTLFNIFLERIMTDALKVRS